MLGQAGWDYSGAGRGPCTPLSPSSQPSVLPSGPGRAENPRWWNPASPRMKLEGGLPGTTVLPREIGSSFRAVQQIPDFLVRPCN